MNTVEERLWSYIDGACDEEERKAIDMLIATDEAYKHKFEELLSLDHEFSAMEPDEPSMGFTYKVMEGIREEYARQPLKAAINKRIIRGIGGFFVVTILLLVIIVLSTLHLTPVSFSVHLPASLKLPGVQNYLNGPVLYGFIFFDVIFGMFLLDAYLRRRKTSGHIYKP